MLTHVAARSCEGPKRVGDQLCCAVVPDFSFGASDTRAQIASQPDHTLCPYIIPPTVARRGGAPPCLPLASPLRLFSLRFVSILTMPRAKTTAPMLRTLLPVLAAVFTPTLAGNVQLPGLELPSDATTHRTAVKEIFTTAYATYKEKAWGHDDLAPLSGGFNDPRNGWGATVIDALSTMAVMGLDDLFEEGVEFATKIDFSDSKTDDTVSVFETTIRYVGGLLSAYELGGKKEHALIDRAQEVADKMTVAWVGDNALPYGYVGRSPGRVY